MVGDNVRRVGPCLHGHADSSRGWMDVQWQSLGYEGRPGKAIMAHAPPPVLFLTENVAP